MKPEIFITGSGGFVGSYLRVAWKDSYTILGFERTNTIVINSQYVLHLAGIAHDVRGGENEQLYWEVNTELTKKVFDAFLASSAEVFIFLSSIKVIGDVSYSPVQEDCLPAPQGIYALTKLAAEAYITTASIPPGKRVYILRPSIIHGPGIKGNLASLQNIVDKGIPWPFAAFKNQRSFCSIQNLAFVIREMLENAEIPSGIYHLADDEPISTNDLIRLIASARKKRSFFIPIPQCVIRGLAQVGSKIGLPLNQMSLNKLTGSFLVSNDKIRGALGKPLPLRASEGILLNFK